MSTSTATAPSALTLASRAVSEARYGLEVALLAYRSLRPRDSRIAGRWEDVLAARAEVTRLELIEAEELAARPNLDCTCWECRA